MPQHLDGVLPGPARRARSRPRWRCSTSASPPTRCRSGGSRIRSAISRTTARSTPSRATATGRWRAARCSARRCCRTCRTSCRSSRCTARIRRASTTCSRCCLMGGLDPMHAMRLLMPPAWQSVDGIDPDLRAFYEFYAPHMEPWDGPAGIVLTDGRYACVRAGPQRPASGALRHHEEPPPDHRLRDRACGTTSRKTWCARASMGPGAHDRAGPADRHAARERRTSTTC